MGKRKVTILEPAMEAMVEIDPTSNFNSKTVSLLPENLFWWKVSFQ